MRRDARVRQSDWRRCVPYAGVCFFSCSCHLYILIAYQIKLRKSHVHHIHFHLNKIVESLQLNTWIYVPVRPVQSHHPSITRDRTDVAGHERARAHHFHLVSYIYDCRAKLGPCFHPVRAQHNLRLSPRRVRLHQKRRSNCLYLFKY